MGVHRQDFCRNLFFVIHEGKGIALAAIHTELEMQVWSRGIARAADFGDLLAAAHHITHFHEVGAVVAVMRDDTVAMVDGDEIPVLALPSNRDHLAVHCGKYGSTSGRVQVHAFMAASVTDPFLFVMVLDPDDLRPHSWTPCGADAAGLHWPNQVHMFPVNRREFGGLR